MAADQAVAEARMLHPEVSTSDLKVDLPKTATQQRYLLPPPPPPPPILLAQGGHPPGNVGRVRRAPRRGARVPPAQQQPHFPDAHAYLHRFPIRENDRYPQLPYWKEPQAWPGLQHPIPRLPENDRYAQPWPGHQLQVPRLQENNHHVQPLPSYRRRGPLQFAPILEAPVLQAPVAYRQAMTHAMVGQYQPAGGSVEVGGRMLRFRAGPVQHNNQMMGNVNVPRPNDNLAQSRVGHWMQE